MSCGRSENLPVLPFTLPAYLVDTDLLFHRELKNSTHIGFRRVYFRRRESSGEYESDWQLIDSTKIISYGSTSISIDDKKLNFFDQSGITMKCDNSNGYFSDETYRGSFWSGYLSQYRTLVKVVAGYDVGCDTPVEVPSATTLFYGVITDEVDQGRDNVTTFKFRSLASVLDEVSAGDLNISSASTMTASALIGVVRDHVDANGIAIFQKFISVGAWSIAATTQAYPNITTTSLESMSCLDMIQQLAAAERYIIYINSDGGFVFSPRTAGATSVYSFFGGARYGGGQAHTIINITKFADAIQKVYNRIDVKYLKADTSTSHAIASESWTWGDGSSSFKYGVRELKITNDWVSTSGAAAIASTLLNEYSRPKSEITFISKFFPGLNVLDRITVSYGVVDEESSLWGTAVIDRDVWAASTLQHNEFRDTDFYVLKVSHNIDKFTTEITGREP